MSRLSDRQLAKLGREYEAIKLRIKTLEGHAERRQAKILKELDLRGTKALVVDDVKVTRVQGSNVVYDYPQILRKLTPEVRKLVMKRTVDAGAFSRAVQAGKIDVALVDKYSEVKPKKAYIQVSGG